MNHRFDYSITVNSITKIIESIKKEIRQVQEERYYDAVGRITDVQRVNLVQTLKLFQKEHLGEIKLVSTCYAKGVVRTEHIFTIGNEQVVKMFIHGSETGFIYINAVLGYDSVALNIMERFKK